jgi:tRNA(Ile)-lysidine synthase TilS/MesJ
MKGRTLIDLSVIKIQSEILGVKILRPLLGVPKQEIFDLAHSNNIPYFKNTTPLWSNRGQFREIIQPAIIKTFGQGVLTNLSKIGQESDELQQLIKLNIIDPYMSKIEFKNEMYYLPLVPGQPFTFWKYIFHEFCHLNNISLISHKLLSHIYEKLYSNNESSITCNSNIKLMIKNDYIIIKITL